MLSGQLMGLGLFMTAILLTVTLEAIRFHSKPI
jgi:hypothetical protein